MTSQPLLLSFRRIIKNRILSSVLIAGLSLVLYCGFIVSAYLDAEVNSEAQYSQKDRIHLLYVHYKNGDQQESFDITSHGLNKLMMSIPEIEQVVQLYEFDATIGETEGSIVKEDEFYYTDDSLWQVFDLEFLDGLPEYPLSTPNAIVISENIAKKYFNSVDVAGEVLTVNQQPHLIKGVFKNLPGTTHRKFEAFLSLPPEQKNYETGSFECFTYLLLKKHIDTEKFTNHLEHFDTETFQPMIEKLFDGTGFTVRHSALPIAKIREHQTGYISSGFFIAVLALLVIILGVNTTNLSMINGLQRLKDIGIRKVVGASKIQLAYVYFLESFMLAILSLLLAVTLFQVTANEIENFFQYSILLNLSSASAIVTGIAILFFFILIYNLSLHSLFQTKSMALIKKTTGSTSKQKLNKWILGFQFMLSFLVITCTWTIYKQYDYMTSTSLGFEKNEVVTITLPYNDEARSKGSDLAHSIRNIPGIDEVAMGNRPGYVPYVSTYSTDGGSTPLLVNCANADDRLIELLGIKIIKGSNFDPAKQALYKDHIKDIIINEAFAKKLGWDNPIGKKINYEGTGRIVGVVENYHFKTLRSEIEPFLLEYNKDRPEHLLIKTSANDFSAIEATWYEFFPNEPFNITYLDQQLDDIYNDELRLSQFMGFLALVGILISGIGLFAISYYTQLARTKEIGIRKVLGASIPGLVRLLSGFIFKIIGLAVLVAAPFAIYISGIWLEQYYYRIELNLFLYFIPLILLVLVALLSVGFHTVKNALSNPVESLRYE